MSDASVSALESTVVALVYKVLRLYDFINFIHLSVGGGSTLHNDNPPSLESRNPSTLERAHPSTVLVPYFKSYGFKRGGLLPLVRFRVEQRRRAP